MRRSSTPRILIAFGARGPSMLSLINAVFSRGAIAAPYGFILMGGNPRPVFWAIAGLSVLAWGAAWKAGMAGVHPPGASKGVRLRLPILSLALLAIRIEARLAGLGPFALIRIGMEEGGAARLLQEAEGYKQSVSARAEGDASRFKQLVAEYSKAPGVTRDRLYIDAMQQIFSNTTKIMVDQKSGGNLLYLPLDKLMQKMNDGHVATPAKPTTGETPRASERVR